jgi:hypothetical protein
MKTKQIVPATKAQAEKLTAKVVAQWKSMERSWWALGKLVSECLEKRVPAALGMNARDWMEKNLPGSSSKAWRSLRIVRALTGIPEKEVKLLTESNAYALTRLPEKKRKSKDWIKKAVESPTKEFEEAVEAEREQRTGMKRESFVTLRLAMPQLVFEQWEEGIKRLARILELDIEGNEARRITCYEAIARLLIDTPEDALKGELIGGYRENLIRAKAAAE